jgi:hypothetical protein
MVRILPVGLIIAPAFLLLAACGGGGGGGDGGDDPTAVALPTLVEREAFASTILDEQSAILASGLADPAILQGSATYSGSWALSLDPGGNLEIIGGSASLQADFGAGNLTGSLQQEILDGAQGTLTIRNGQIAGAIIAGDVVGDLGGQGASSSFSVATGLDGFFANAGLQGTMSGTATVDGQPVGAEGSLVARPD